MSQMWNNWPHFTRLCQKIVQPPVKPSIKPPVKSPIKPPVKPSVKTPVHLIFIPVLNNQTRQSTSNQSPDVNVQNSQENEFSNDK